ncbi:MAG: diversity-generating retroelement protein Avd [Pigmentiphaga sp.]|nr:diversity-generating retroelement protein Avd [Pigmentiphaga sp.]
MSHHLDGLKILTKLEELDAYSHKVALQFPKYERHVLSAEIRTTLNRLLHLTVTAAKRYHKKTTLHDLDIEVEYLRALIRKAWRLRYITEHRYEIWSRHIDEIGRMVGGWIKSVQGNGR